MLRNILFLFLLILFLLHQYVERVRGARFPWVDNYLDAFLFMPILLTVVLWERRWLWKKGRAYSLPLRDVAGYGLLVCLLAEGLFPLLHPGFTRDFADVLLYFLGCCVFLFAMNAPVGKRML